MYFLPSPLILLLVLMMGYTHEIESRQGELANPSAYVSDEVWEKIQDYLIPNDHPIKGKLDQIFLGSRALADQRSMEAAGFAPAHIQEITHIIVTTHPELPGYVIKAYLDKIKDPNLKSEHYYLIKRVKGARLVRESIKAHNYEHLLKVPEKWIYLLPDEPSPPKHYLRKKFILVEDDMDIFSEKKNKSLWRSEKVTKELLQAVYTVATELTLSDSTKPSNCQFSKDGRLAFLDTEMYNTGHMKYYKMTPYLSLSMKAYWEKLTYNKNK